MSLRYGLLGLLTYNDMSGYDLKKAFESSLQFMWSAKSSQIYRELGKLEEEGLVSSRIEPQDKKFDRKVYSITSSGKNSFQKWVENFPSNLEVPVRDEFIVRVFFGENLSVENLTFEIKRFKKQRVEALAVLSNVSKSAKEAAKQDGLEKSYYYWTLTIKKALKEIKAEIEWAEEAIEELKNRS
ncbi:MAG: PadR family transcriptional regulator [Clostridiaceae bacterium]|nr:PadR family transcriptional regulator [Clostridiaceae bacterium]